MKTIIYTYKANPILLMQKYPHAQLQAELLPLPSPYFHRVLDDLVTNALKTPAMIVVQSFEELGDRIDSITQNVKQITRFKHKLKVDSKDVIFESFDEFKTYFQEFVNIFEKEHVAHRGRQGRPDLMSDDMKTLARGLRAPPNKMTYEAIAEHISANFGVTIGKAVVHRYLTNYARGKKDQDE